MYRRHEDDPHLHTLRDALAGEPDRHRWWCVVRLLEAWPAEETHDTALRTACEAIDDWPSHVAHFPLSWVRDIVHGADVPRSALGRSLWLERVAPPPPLMGRLWSSPSIAQVRSIDVSRCKLGDDGLTALARSPHAGAVRELGITSNGMTDEGCRALAGAAFVRELQTLRTGGHRNVSPAGWSAIGGAAEQLRELDLWNQTLTEDDVPALAPLLERLEVLRIRYSKLDDAVLDGLLGACGPRLRELDLQSSPVGDRTAARLSAPDAFPGLRALSLAKTRIQPDTGETLARVLFGRLQRLSLANLWDRTAARTLAAMATAGACELESLSLSRAGVTDDMLAPLLDKADMAPLRSLDLSFSKISARGLRALLDATCGAALRELTLGNGDVHFGDAGLEAIAGHRSSATLEKLSVSGALYASSLNRPIGARSVAAIVGSQHLTRLKELSFRRTDVGDRGAAALARWESARRLRRLGLEWSQVTSRGVEELMRSPFLTTLRGLDLGFDELSASTVERLLTGDVFPMMTELELSKPPASLLEPLLTSPRVGWSTQVELHRPDIVYAPPSSPEEPSLFDRAIAAITELVGLDDDDAPSPVTPPDFEPGPFGTGDATAREETPMGEHDLGGPLNDMLLLADGTAVFLHADTLTAMALDGTVRWTREGGRVKEPWQPRAFAASVVRDGSLLVAYRDGYLGRLDPHTGSLATGYAPAKRHQIYGSVALATAPAGDVAVVVGAADSGSFEGVRRLRMVAWDLARESVIWSHDFEQRHQMLPLAPVITASGACYHLLEERTGGGSVVSKTHLRRGPVRAGPPVEVVDTDGGLRALAVQGDTLLGISRGGVVRWSGDPPYAFEPPAPCPGLDRMLVVAADGSRCAGVTAEGDVAILTPDASPRIIALYEKFPRHLTLGSEDLLVGYGHGMVLHYRN